MQDSADAKAYEDSLRQLLGEATGWHACLPRGARACLAHVPTSPAGRCAAWCACLAGPPRVPAPHAAPLCAGESLNPAEEEAAAAELQQLEAQLLDEQGMEMPKAPTAVARAEAAAAAAQEQPGGAVAAAVTSPEEVLLAQLPSVPKTPVQLAEGEPVEPEKEPAMLAA